MKISNKYNIIDLFSNGSTAGKDHTTLWEASLNVPQQSGVKAFESN